MERVNERYLKKGQEKGIEGVIGEKWRERMKDIYLWVVITGGGTEGESEVQPEGAGGDV